MNFRVKQTAVKTIISPSPPAKECVQLSVTVPVSCIDFSWLFLQNCSRKWKGSIPDCFSPWDSPFCLFACSICPSSQSLFFPFFLDQQIPDSDWERRETSLVWSTKSVFAVLVEPFWSMDQCFQGNCNILKAKQFSMHGFIPENMKDYPNLDRHDGIVHPFFHSRPLSNRFRPNSFHSPNDFIHCFSLISHQYFFFIFFVFLFLSAIQPLRTFFRLFAAFSSWFSICLFIPHTLSPVRDSERAWEMKRVSRWSPSNDLLRPPWEEWLQMWPMRERLSRFSMISSCSDRRESMGNEESAWEKGGEGRGK